MSKTPIGGWRFFVWSNKIPRCSLFIASRLQTALFPPRALQRHYLLMALLSDSSIEGICDIFAKTKESQRKGKEGRLGFFYTRADVVLRESYRAGR